MKRKHTRDENIHAFVSDLGKVAFVLVTFAYAVLALYLWGPYIIRGVQTYIGSW